MRGSLIHLISLLVFLKIRFGTSEIQFGGIFEAENELQKAAFLLAVDRESKTGIVEFSGVTENVDRWKILQADKTVCRLFRSRSVAVFGPSLSPAKAYVNSLCDRKEIPHIATKAALLNDKDSALFSISVFPPERSVGTALADLVQKLTWKSFVVLYEEGRALTQLQDLLQLSSKYKGPKVTVRQMPKRQISSYKALLKEIKIEMRETQIIVHAKLESARVLLEIARILRMTEDRYHFVFPDLDFYTLDLESYIEDGCNITSLRLVDPHAQNVQNLLKEIRKSKSKTPIVLPAVGIQTDVALIMDSVAVVSNAVRRLGAGIMPNPISCDSESTWRNGTTFMNFLKMTEYKGLTGAIQFDSYGKRTNFAYSLIQLQEEGFRQVGVWNSTTGLNMTKSKELAEPQVNLENKTLRVTVYLEEPFVMYKQTEKTLYGNDRYEGFCIDMLHEIARIRKFQFTIQEVKDSAYGGDIGNGTWDGMVGELMRGEADIALASLTITFGRTQVIDFTVPYMNLGVSILFKQPKKSDPSLFSFLSPLSLTVWLYVLAAYVFVSFTLWILARFTPYEWENSHPCDPDNDEVENQFNLLNSFWFTIGSMMQQGSELAPRAASTRLVAGIWWFFTMILISSYTANLAAFLTVERMVSPIESADDLVKQTKIKYGTLDKGSTKSFFKHSKIETYSKMWDFMSADSGNFVKHTPEAIRRIKDGNYAYMMESLMLEYYIERDCDLMQVNGLLNSNGYGVGLKHGSPYRDSISSAILMLQENTLLTSLKLKWWKQKRGGGKCVNKDESKKKHHELGLQNVGGVFVFMIVGLSGALVLALFEFVYKSLKHAEIDKKDICSEMWQDLKFAMRCKKGASKKVASRKVSIVGYPEHLDYM